MKLICNTTITKQTTTYITIEQCERKANAKVISHLRAATRVAQTRNLILVNTARCLTVDPTFGNFVIAHIADDYLKGKDNDILCRRLNLLLLIRYVTIPWIVGKDVGLKSENTRNCNKYGGDIRTESGRIICIASEISCDCMEEERITAKSMEKVVVCYCCQKEFLKKKMLRCLGCDGVLYCSKECSIKAWPTHKANWRRNSSSPATTQATTLEP